MKHIVLALSLLSSLGGSTTLLAGERQPPVGGYTAIDTHDPGVVGAAHFAVFTLNQDPTSPVYRLEKILSAEAQIVAGVNYRLKLLLTSEDGQEVKELVVFHQAWTNTWQLKN
jgi:hypothetical protein